MPARHFDCDFLHWRFPQGVVIDQLENFLLDGTRPHLVKRVVIGQFDGGFHIVPPLA